MAVQATPYVETALSHDSELFRRSLQAGLPIGSAGGIVPATAGTSANLTAGVTGFQDLLVEAPASGMSVNVWPGGVIIPGSLGQSTNYGMPTGYGYPTITTNGASAPTIAAAAHATQIALTTQGAYYGYNDYSSGLDNLTISASGANPRIDVVVAQVEDADYSGSNNDWKLAVITGTPGASPTVPTLPASCVPLALVWVPASASDILAADIIDLRVAYNRNPFRASMYRAAAYTFTATGIVPLDTISEDLTESCTTGGSCKYTAPISGVYSVSIAVVGTPNASSIQNAQLEKNGSVYKIFMQGYIPSANSIGLGGSATCSLNAGDYINPFLYIGSSSSWPLLVSGSQDNWMGVALLSPQ